MTRRATAIGSAALLLLALGGCSLQLRDDGAGTDAGDDTPVSSAPEGPEDSEGEYSMEVSPRPGGEVTNAGAAMSGDCAGRDVMIDQIRSAVDLSGRCGTVTITGAGSGVTLEDVTTLRVEADDVSLFVSGTAELVDVVGSGGGAIFGEVGSLAVGGRDASVSVDRVDVLTVTGSRNTITWGESTTAATDSGTANILVGP